MEEKLSEGGGGGQTPAGVVFTWTLVKFCQCVQLPCPLFLKYVHQFICIYFR